MEILKAKITDSGNIHIGKVKQKTIKKPWVTNDMIRKMEERRKWKNVNTNKGRQTYRKLNDDLKRQTKEARENWWKNQCDDIENMNRKGRSDLVYERVRHLCGE